MLPTRLFHWIGPHPFPHTIPEPYLKTCGVKWHNMVAEGKSVAPGIPWLTLESMQATMARHSLFFPTQVLSEVCALVHPILLCRRLLCDSSGTRPKLENPSKIHYCCVKNACKLSPLFRLYHWHCFPTRGTISF
jgi:hypothetical protein